MKKALIAVSFGTSYPETRKKTIEAVEQKLTETITNYDVYRAFTSTKVIKKIKEQEGIEIPTVLELMEKLRDNGYQEVVVQPLHIIPGSEYIKALHQASCYEKDFERIRVGSPLLSSFEDYQKVIAWMKKLASDLTPEEAIVFMGHGSQHPAFTAYACLDHLLLNKPIFVCAVESYPEIASVIERLKTEKNQKIQLHPLMLVAGDHATNDMASDDEDSWKSQLQRAGFQVESYLKGMGEYPEIQEQFIEHAQVAIQSGEGYG